MNHPALADDEEFRAELAHGRSEQAQQLRHLHRADGPVRRHLRPRARRPRAAAPVLRRRRRARGGERAQGRVRLEEPAQRGARASTPSSAPRCCISAARSTAAAATRCRSPTPTRTRSPGSRSSTGRASTAPHRSTGADIDARGGAALAPGRARPSRPHPHDIACIITEPIQGEGGDNHFRPSSCRDARAVPTRTRRCSIFDEVQTGCGLTGTAWAYQQLGVAPDVVAFGKKTQVCGMMAGRRVDEVPDNVFRGQLADQLDLGRQPGGHGALPADPRDHRARPAIRARRRAGRTAAPARRAGRRLPAMVLDVRGRGLMCAFACRAPPTVTS